MLGINLLKFLTLAAISTVAMAHSRMSNPAPRNPDGLAFGHAAGNCESPDKSPKATYKRGQEITVNWARNNHVGGFIRLAIAPMASSDEEGIFEKTDNIEQLHCHESDCGPADPLNYPAMLGGDPPGKNQAYQNTCTKKFTIPNHLADGTYTLQWYWYGPGSHYANTFQSEGEYKTCHDFTVSGGEAVKPKPTGTCPVYKGGDIHQHGDKCIYMYMTEPHQCTVQQAEGRINTICGGQLTLNYTFGYPYPNLYKTCKKDGKQSTKRHLDGSDFSTTNITAPYSDVIKEVKGLEKYYR